MGHMTLFLTLAPKADDTICTSLPKEIRLALRSHKTLFHQGGLVLSVASSIPTPLLTLLCLEQADQVSTPTERPRRVSNVVVNVAPQGHVP
jgi:hypothetical protein